ncbi:MAG: hypothetical protein C5B44_04660 [Acidobacteria bacterium]|nr:MAG: hypothetical protein C5B44_04660 [Acidobacteriota bacterium]
MTPNYSAPTPSRAYWNHRHALAEFRPRAEQLQQAVDRIGDLLPFQWAQLFVMALEFKPDLILELGRGVGNSTCVFTEAANRLGSCSVISMDLGDSWEKITVPKIRKIVPADWFQPLQALRANILTFDFGTVFKNVSRVLIFWDAHGFDIAECVLGRILPAIEHLSHLVIMHDLCDARYIPETISLSYKDYYLWKGSNAELKFVRLGHVVSAVAQAISIIDFTSRNGLALHSADDDLHTDLANSERQTTELRALLGDDLFSLSAWWHWLSLNEKSGPYTFPKYDYEEILRKQDLEEKMRGAYELEKQMDNERVTFGLRLKVAAKILLNRYPKEFSRGIIWDVIKS